MGNFFFIALLVTQKNHKETFLLLALFTDEKRGKSHIRGLSSLLYISPCRLAATSANKMPRPSHYSLTTATGSKRSSADSDLLLCHAKLWRTSRLEFWGGTGCEHSEMRFITVVPSAYAPNSRPPHLYMRACRQCVHESARFPRVICSHAW